MSRMRHTILAVVAVVMTGGAVAAGAARAAEPSPPNPDLEAARRRAGGAAIPIRKPCRSARAGRTG